MPIGRRIANIGARAAAMPFRPVARGVQGGNAIRGQMRKVSGRTIDMHQNSRFRNNRALRFAARHPFATALGPGYGLASGYMGLPNGRSTSRRNQNDPYLRRVRSAAANRSLPGHSLGGMTGY